LYLDDDLWSLLHANARGRKTTISELVREVVRERYAGKSEERKKAMREFVGAGKTGMRRNAPDSAAYVRGLRRGKRMDRLFGK
jgi:hypothetical protein